MSSTSTTSTALTHASGAAPSACDLEPIHHPGHIQPTGAMVVVDCRDFLVRFASRNIEAVIGVDWTETFARPLQTLLGKEDGPPLREALARPRPDGDPALIRSIVGHDGHTYLAIGHRNAGRAFLELEQVDPDAVATHRGLYPEFREFLTRLASVRSVESLSRVAVAEVRRLTGFDRVLVYRFDPEGHGSVVAEECVAGLPSYLGLRFPATDIPAQARELYRVNRLRIISDVDYVPIPVERSPAEPTPGPLDMTFCTLRSVSPVHLEYMRNMGTGASMSISLLREGKLWGLIACHSLGPRRVNFEIRTACDLIGQVLSLQITSQENTDEYERRVALKSIQTRLLASMAREDQVVQGLFRVPSDLLGLTGAEGGAVLHEGRCVLIGSTPGEDDVRRIVAWLGENGRDELFVTDSLPNLAEWADDFRDAAVGLLAIAISKLHDSYVLWFRPEVVRTVDWAGDPTKPVLPGPDDRPHPRRSFELWKQTVERTSEAWHPAEVEAAGELRGAIVGIVLLKAEELAQLADELKRSNRELEAFSYSVSHDLRAPFRHIVGYSELLLDGMDLGDESRRFVNTIIDSARFAGTLVDNLLSLAQMGRSALHKSPVDMNRLVADVRRELIAESPERTIRWQIHPLPTCFCDPLMVKVVIRNLLANAVKYTRKRDEANIEIGCEEHPGESALWVKDDGIGFDMKYVGKLFGVFQRLHRMEEFEGTGIGLANVHRIVERHGGRSWAEGKPNQGATFWFTLPREAGSR